MKRGLPAALALICFTIHAQEFEKNFYDSCGRAAEEAKSSYYHLIKKHYHDGDTSLSYYTKTGSIRSMAIVDRNGIRNGPVVYYYDNGTVKAKGNYEKGQISGEAHTWYADGNPQSVEVFIPMKDGEMGSFTLSDYWDSKGNHIVANGKGFCECYLNVLADDPFSSSRIIAKGKVMEGLRDSVWVGHREDGTKYYEEIYEHGALRSGVSTDSAGIRYTYTKEAEMAMPAGGMQAIADHLRSTLVYPKSARKKGVEGKVFVEFVVAKDGKVTKVKVLKGIGGDCDEEAVRAVRSFPPWNPGKKRGQPMNFRMVLPVSFRLQ